MANNPNSSEFTVGILGAGAMGRGIAQIIATGGMRVLLFDNNDVAVAAGRRQDSSFMISYLTRKAYEQ